MGIRMIQTQLLCTFIEVNNLDMTIQQIQDSYTLAFNNVYVLENVDDTAQYILTYNIAMGSLVSGKVPPASTISVHRKKQTNTIYTINALNALIASKNGGIVDKSFKVDWNELKNCIVVTAHGQLKMVRTKLVTIIDIETPYK
jgi:hypothetical protein